MEFPLHCHPYKKDHLSPNGRFVFHKRKNKSDYFIHFIVTLIANIAVKQFSFFAVRRQVVPVAVPPLKFLPTDTAHVGSLTSMVAQVNP